ncbi:MAG: DUF975 family protein [Candidatus Zixiibacteriota bacterium]|nr:MAG: DUF975 family protein [candidate division Zixibacteria bacterium]
MSNQLSIGECVSEGWNGLKQNAGAAIGGFVVFCLIEAVGGVIPVVNIIFGVLVTPALVGGLMILSLNLARNSSPEVGDIFKGFRKYGSFLGAYWLFALISLLCCIPAFIGVGIDSTRGSESFGLTIVLGLVSAVILVIVMLRWCMVYYLVAEGSGVTEAFTKSSKITEGYRGTIFLLGIVNFLIIIAGLLVLGVGYFVAAPIAMIAFASAYTRLKSFASPEVRATQQ